MTDAQRQLFQTPKPLQAGSVMPVREAIGQEEPEEKDVEREDASRRHTSMAVLNLTQS